MSAPTSAGSGANVTAAATGGTSDCAGCFSWSSLRTRAVTGRSPAPPPAAPAAVQDRPEPRALSARQEVHLHFYGVTAEDVAAILARVNHEDREHVD